MIREKSKNSNSISFLIIFYKLIHHPFMRFLRGFQSINYTGIAFSFLSNFYANKKTEDDFAELTRISFFPSRSFGNLVFNYPIIFFEDLNLNNSLKIISQKNI